MNEIFDAATLAEHGYTLDANNALLDSGGNYLESVTINGKTMASAIGSEEFNTISDNQTILDENNFTADPYSELPSYIQEEKVVADHYLRKYQENATETVIPQEVLESDSMNEVFEQDRQNKMEKGEPAYPDVATMIQGEEGETFLADLAPEDIPLYKNLLVERKKILAEETDIKTSIEETSDKIDMAASSLKGVNPIASVGTEILSGIVDFSSNFFKSGYGIEDKKRKERLQEIDAQVTKLEQPFALKTIADIEAQIADITSMRETQEGVGPQDSLRLDYAQKILEQERENLKDFTSGSYIPTNVFTIYNAIEQGTRGLTGLITETPAELILKNDLNSGEELDASQTVLASAFAMKSKIGEAQIKQTFVHELLTGVNESLKFIGFGKFGRVAGKKLATKIISKTRSGKVARALTNTATQAIMHPNTYSAAASEFSGAITEVENVDGTLGYTTDRHTFDSLQAEMDMNLKAIEAQIEQEKENPERVASLIQAKESLQETKKKLITDEPAGALGAFGYGFVESAKEAFSETYFGPLMGKIVGRTKNTGIGRYLTGSKTGKWLNSSNSALKDVFNKKFGESVMPGQRLIGSNIEEWGEEVFVQLIPSVGTTAEEYKHQLGELLTMDFHQKVVAQTLVMNKGAQAIGWSSQNWDKYKGSMNVFNKDTRTKSKKTRTEARELKKTIKSLGNINQSAQSFEVNLMGTGEGSFNMSDYNTRISNLRSEGLFTEASKLERDKIYKQAVAAVNSGNGKEFQKAMVKAQHNRNLSPETKSVIKQLEVEVTEMIDDSNTFLNSNTILSLKSKNRFAKQSLLDIEKAQM